MRQIGSCTPLFLLLIFGVARTGGAKDLSAYRLGDLLEEDIIAPAALAVPDPAATAALKASEALKTPVVFRSFPAITNAMASQFEVAFETARSNFINTLQDNFHAAILDHATITSPDFGYVVTAYNFDHPELPLPTYLAMDWAYGKDGSVEKILWLNKICALMQNPIRPDNLPPGCEMGDTVQLVPVNRPDEMLTPGEVLARARIVPQSTMVPLSLAQLQLRHEFTGDDEQLLARALSAWLQPNCLPDADLTQEARDQAVRRFVVAEYYGAGQVIAAKGSLIDRKIMAALDQLTRRPTAIAPIPVGGWRETQAPISLELMASVDQELIADPGPPVPTATPFMLASLSPFKVLQMAGAIAVAAIILVLIRQMFRPQKRTLSMIAGLDELPMKNPPRFESELAPQILQVVRQAFIHELAGQRRDLLMAQQAAAAEVIRLVQRMDALQVAMQDRLRAYEAQIQHLEAELIARKEENRQLIRLKIQMIRHQVDLESASQRIELN